jgi:hypothetical protein
MLRFLTFLLLSIVLSWAAKPMESLNNYNVIMVHGAADGQSNGFECNDAKEEPYDMLQNHLKQPDIASWQIGEAVGMIGSYENSDKLTNWLDTRIFESKVKYDGGKKRAADSSSI